MNWKALRLIMLLLLIALTTLGTGPCATTGGPQSIYIKNVEEIAQNLALHIKEWVVSRNEGTKKIVLEGSTVGQTPVEGWNGLLNRIYDAFDMKLKDSRSIEVLSNQWLFYEDQFDRIKCPDEIIRPDLAIKLTVEHLRADREFKIKVNARWFDSKRVATSYYEGLRGPAYEKALENWSTPASRPKGMAGSASDPFSKPLEMGKFFGRIIKCNVEIASREWQERHGGNVDFSRLNLRFLGVRPGPDVCIEKARQISQTLYQGMSETVPSLVLDERDFEKVITEIDRYDRFHSVYLHGKEAGRTEFVPSEACIVGDVHLGGDDPNRLVVSIRTVLTTRRVGGTPSQGVVVPDMGASSYMKDIGNQICRQPRLTEPAHGEKMFGDLAGLRTKYDRLIEKEKRNHQVNDQIISVTGDIVDTCNRIITYIENEGAASSGDLLSKARGIRDNFSKIHSNRKMMASIDNDTKKYLQEYEVLFRKYRELVVKEENPDSTTRDRLQDMIDELENIRSGVSRLTGRMKRCDLCPQSYADTIRDMVRQIDEFEVEIQEYIKTIGK
jgi:hypothetical protein